MENTKYKYYNAQNHGVKTLEGAPNSYLGARWRWRQIYVSEGG